MIHYRDILLRGLAIFIGMMALVVTQMPQLCAEEGLSKISVHLLQISS